MIVAKIKKETLDITRLVVDLSKWLDPVEVVTAITTPSVAVDYSCTPVFADLTPLVVNSSAITGAGSTVTLMLGVGTPGVRYIVEFEVTGGSGRIRTIDVQVGINLPVGATLTPADLASIGVVGGPLLLFRDPVQSNEAATKHYVDAADATKLPLTGGTITGNLTVTGSITGGGGSFLPLTGGTLTGALVGTSGAFTGALSANSGAVVAGADANGQLTLGSLSVARTPYIDFHSTGTATNGFRVISLGAGNLTFQPNGSTTAGSFNTNGLVLSQTAAWSGATTPAAVRATMTITGTSTVSNVQPNGYSTIINDSVDRSVVTPNCLTGYDVHHNYGGGTTKGGRTAFNAILLQQNGANADTGADNFYVGATAYAFARSTQPGSTSAVPLGRVFGFNADGEIQGSFVATNYYQIASAEFNVGISAGSSAAIRSGVTIADGVSASQGYWSDNMLWLYGAGQQWRYGVCFGDTQQWAIDPTAGTMLGANYGFGYNVARPMSAKWGVDLQQVLYPATNNAYDGGAFRSNGFAVNGAGRMQIGSTYLTPSATGLAIDAAGSVGTAAAIATAGSGYTANVEVFTAFGGVWTVATVAGVPTGAMTQLVAPAYPSTTPPSNPITLTNLSRQSQGSGLTANLTWNTTANALSLNPSGGPIKAPLLTNAANDAAAATAGVAVNQFYRAGSVVMQRAA